MTTDLVTARALNGLIIACRNDVATLDDAARVISAPDQKEWLREIAASRRLFVSDLAIALRDRGREPAKHGSLGTAIRGLFGRLRTLVGGAHEGDAYARCARVEARLEKLYDNLLVLDLRDGTRFPIARQRTTIARDHSRLKRLRDLS